MKRTDIRGGDQVIVEGRKARVVSCLRKGAEKGGGRTRSFRVVFDDQSMAVVSRRKIEKVGPS